jgi:hypothetical protein
MGHLLRWMWLSRFFIWLKLIKTGHFYDAAGGGHRAYKHIVGQSCDQSSVWNMFVIVCFFLAINFGE